VSVGISTVAYIASFALLALTLKHLSLGTTYAIWSGVGTLAIAVVGQAVYHELISFTTAAGIALVGVGVVLVHLGRGVPRGRS
jgi:small multidrug resistance pump